MTQYPDTALTLVLLALVVAGACWLLSGQPSALRLTDDEVRERFPAIAERIRQRHFH